MRTRIATNETSLSAHKWAKREKKKLFSILKYCTICCAFGVRCSGIKQQIQWNGWFLIINNVQLLLLSFNRLMEGKKTHFFQSKNASKQPKLAYSLHINGMNRGKSIAWIKYKLIFMTIIIIGCAVVMNYVERNFLLLSESKLETGNHKTETWTKKFHTKTRMTRDNRCLEFFFRNTEHGSLFRKRKEKRRNFRSINGSRALNPVKWIKRRDKKSSFFLGALYLKVILLIEWITHHINVFLWAFITTFFFRLLPARQKGKKENEEEKKPLKW